jgi:peptide/nickel transport system substrate-binding protein
MAAPGKVIDVSGSLRRLLAVCCALGLLLAACGGSDDSGSGDGNGNGDNGSAVQPDAGTIVIGAEQEPDCADWISSCAGAAWGAWTMQEHTMPRAFDPVKAGTSWRYAPSLLLAGEPTVEPGPPQRVTYRINPAAVWSDGTPITSADFAYTWDQIANGKDVYDPTGYDQIESVETPDPKTAVVTFKADEPFGSWKQLFGVDYGVFPSHLLEGKNRNKLMRNGYDWSGGPWKIDGWEKGVGVTLVPNDAYWGEKPKVSKVVFRFIENTAREFQAFESNEVDAIYPQSEPSAIELITEGLSGGQSQYTDETGNVEALMMNNEAKPLDSIPVRQAIAYALDREAIVERLFGALGINEPMQTLNPPIVSDYADTTAWSQYTLDLDRVDQLLTGDGWAKGDDGIWAKDGKKLRLTLATDSGNQRRELTEQIIQAQLREAGIDVEIENQKFDDFINALYEADYEMALVANVFTTLEPGLCSILCTDAIPTEENDFSGNNITRTSIPEADQQLQIVDESTDDAARAAAGKTADRILADAQVTLPLDPLPNIAIWSDRIQGQISDNPLLAMFWNMHTWSLSG